MQNSEFEKSVQQKMQDLNIAPSGDLWEKIEGKLPAEKKPQRWLLLLLLFLGLTGASLWVWDNIIPPADRYNKNRESTPDPIEQKRLPAETPIQDETGVPPAKSFNQESLPPNRESTNALPRHEKPTGFKRPINNPSGQPPATRRRNIQIAQAGNTKINTAAPMTEQENDAFVATRKTTEPIKTIGSKDSLPGTTMIDRVPAGNDNPGSSQNSRKDTLLLTTKPGTPHKENVMRPEYGIHAGAGFSSVKTGLFSNAALFADAQRFNSGGPSNSPAVAAPNNPKSAFSFSAGVYMKKRLNKNWTLHTGLDYSYQSGALRIGNKVDSVSSQYFDTRKILTNGFYRTGNAVNYKNKFHLVEIPLLIQYTIAKRWPLFAEIGSGAGYLLESNALVYNSRSRTYITDEALFNNFILSLNAGAGLDLAKKTRLPFTIGYRFNYSISSVTKKTYGKQHLLNSLFYIEVPLKK